MDRFKVVADGSILGCRLYAPDGTDISYHVRSATWHQRAGELPTLMVEILNPRIEIEIPAELVEKDYVDGELIDERGVVEDSALGDEYRHYSKAPDQLNG